MTIDEPRLNTLSPTYVHADHESVRVPKQGDAKQEKLRRAVLVILGIIVVGSLLLGDNLLGELSWPTRLLLLSLCIGVFATNRLEKAPSAFELRFYDDYLIFFRDKHYYNRRVIRREFNKFFYKDIHRIHYRQNTKRMTIYGVVEAVWYDWSKDDTLPTEPTYHKTVDGLAYFYTDFLEHGDIVSVIEQHCPISVEVDLT